MATGTAFGPPTPPSAKTVAEVKGTQNEAKPELPSLGSIVIFRAADSTYRPAIVVQVCGPDKPTALDLVVFYNGPLDRSVAPGNHGGVNHYEVRQGQAIGQWQPKP